VCDCKENVELCKEITETVYTMQSLGFSENRISDYVSWISLHDYQTKFRRVNHVTITNFLRRYLSISSDVLYHRQAICTTGRNMNPSSCEDSIGKKVRTALTNFRNKFDSLNDSDKLSFVADRESSSANMCVELQDWCLDNSEILMELGISKCWLSDDNVLSVHCYTLVNNVYELKQTLLDAVCVTDELLGIKLKSVITSKSQLSLHLDLCEIFGDDEDTSDVISNASSNNNSSKASSAVPGKGCEFVPIKQQMITI
jgi:hypothetical protein